MIPDFRSAILLFLICLFAPANDAAPITLGERHDIYSKVLGEQRSLLVALPKHYTTASQKRYPVIFTLDGETHFNHVLGTVDWLAQGADAIPEHIVVAIPNGPGTRTRDLALQAGSTAGPDKFLAFLETEVVPHIDMHYRTQPFRVLAGHSLAGHFALHAFLERPGLFQGTLAFSPYFVVDQGALLKRAPAKLQAEGHPQRFLFLSLGQEPNLKTPFDGFVNLLEKETANLTEWHSETLSEEKHMTTPSLSLHLGLRKLYADLQPKPEIMKSGLTGIKSYFKNLSEKKIRVSHFGGKTDQPIGHIFRTTRKS